MPCDLQSEIIKAMKTKLYFFNFFFSQLLLENKLAGAREGVREAPPARLSGVEEGALSKWRPGG